MESLVKPHHFHQPLHLSLNHRRSSFSSLSFRRSSFRASSSKDPSHKPEIGNALTHLIFSPLFEPAFVAVAATALFFMRRNLNPAVPLPPLAAESTAESLTNEEQLSNHDAEALKSLMETKIRERKIDEAIRVIDRLIELEPEESEWPLLKAEMYIHNGEHELAINGFEDVLKKEPFRVEAFHGLVMANFELNHKPPKELLNRVEEAVEFCKEEKMDSEVRDLKLLIARVKVMEGDFSGAVKVYEELVKEEPRDFRPYLCQSIVYAMLRKKDEAEKNFDEFRRLVPEDHPYKEYFEDKTKVFSQKLEREGISANS